MSDLTVLLPFALPPVAMGLDLIRAMQTPALATLLGRSRLDHAQECDVFSRALPHELWLARAAGMACEDPSNQIAIAARSLARFTHAPSEGIWFVGNPVHLHVARDHLVLTDSRRLVLDDVESRQLFALAHPVCTEYGHTLVYGDATHWFLRADSWHDLQTATPDAACGHNIDIWMPTGTAERAWRKLQNEIQMHWHDAPINQQRESVGMKPVNSLWLWGGAPASNHTASRNFQNVYLPASKMQYFGVTATSESKMSELITAIALNSGDNLLVLDHLIEPALGDDLGEWLLRMNQYEIDWFAPLLAAIKAGAIDQCRFVLTDASRLRERIVSKNSLRKFWHKPSLATLLT